MYTYEALMQKAEEQVLQWERDTYPHTPKMSASDRRLLVLQFAETITASTVGALKIHLSD